MGFGNWAYIPTVATKRHFHVNMEHFNIAFSQDAKCPP
jgi:hypothetical protein